MKVILQIEINRREFDKKEDMITANELRIGNLLQRNDNSIITVSPDDIIRIAQWAASQQLLPKPIPITDKWLAKFGIKENRKFPDNEYFSIDIDNNVFAEWGIYFNGQWITVYIKYIHELQNLYWCVAGKELEIVK